MIFGGKWGMKTVQGRHKILDCCTWGWMIRKSEEELASVWVRQFKSKMRECAKIE